MTTITCITADADLYYTRNRQMKWIHDELLSQGIKCQEITYMQNVQYKFSHIDGSDISIGKRILISNGPDDYIIQFTKSDALTLHLYIPPVVVNDP